MSNATQGARFSGAWAVPPEVLASLTLDVAHSPVPPPLRVALVVGGPDAQGYAIDLGEVRLREWVPTGNNQKTCRVQSRGICPTVILIILIILVIIFFAFRTN